MKSPPEFLFDVFRKRMAAEKKCDKYGNFQAYKSGTFMFKLGLPILNNTTDCYKYC